LANLNATCPEAAPNLAVAIPSRLYYPKVAEKPLNGLRIAIKDNINVAGAKTSGSCKAFGDFYGVRSDSAPAVQRLIDLGVVILGKLGLSQFADAEDPTGDFIDFHAPRSARGDGLRVAGGSSFGCGAATGAYSWIDLTVGTDSIISLYIILFHC
jgi:Asp-tRNA(Asn)/Glu-tRNA(Gln) amidotransferase A subunit family amidase